MHKVAPGINEGLVPTGVRCFLLALVLQNLPYEYICKIDMHPFKFLFNDDFRLSNSVFTLRWQLPNLQSELAILNYHKISLAQKLLTFLTISRLW